MSDALVSQIDLMATLADIVGVALPAGAAEDSESFLPQLQDNASETASRDTLIYNTVPSQYGIWQGDWVFVDAATGSPNHVPDWFKRLNQYPTNDHDSVLTNLSEDLSQRENTVLQDPERAKKMQRLLREMRGRPDETAASHE